LQEKGDDEEGDTDHLGLVEGVVRLPVDTKKKRQETPPFQASDRPV
jgi:hypothetical protein